MNHEFRFRFWIPIPDSGFRFRILDSALLILDSALLIPDSAFLIPDSAFLIPGAENSKREFRMRIQNGIQNENSESRILT
jgi:hypothetical protein